MAPDSNAPALAPTAIHVWWTSLDVPPAEVRRLERLLSADELERAARFRFPRDRQHFTVSRGVLRSILGHYTRQRPEQLRFTYGAHGKPALVQPPDHAPLSFNLSHAAGLALFAFAWRRALGVDLAHIDPAVATLEIAARFFAPDEYACMCALPPEERSVAFFRGWARKEAYIKARGVGLTMALDSFAVTLRPDEPARLIYTRGDAAEATRWSMHTLDLGPDYQAALVIEGGHGQPHVRQWQSSFSDAERPSGG
jgi:4'-phosphopantetheinyl transferase